MTYETADAPKLDLDILDLVEFNESPIFVLEIGPAAPPFELLYSNKGFRNGDLRNKVFAEEPEGLRFRSWAQATGRTIDSKYVFAGYTWSCTLAAKRARLKMIQGAPLASKNLISTGGHWPGADPTTPDTGLASREPIPRLGSLESLRHRNGSPSISMRTLPQANFNARWEGIQTIMEMSEVGVFEYNTEGSLMHANDAWYRLSLYPRDVVDHAQFSFMNLVFEDDQALVMSMWNTLAQGSAVTFEMRWKTHQKSNDLGKWTLTSCVPIFDDEKELISIAGNMIDIDVQKRSQESTQARVEALEQARLSELKFERFAQLSPTAIYIFIPETGMQFVNDQFYELTGQSDAPHDQFEWFGLIADEDVERVEADWAAMLEGHKSNGVQCRLKKTWVNQDGVRDHIWVQCSSLPLVDGRGKVISIMGTLFDISQFKWAESVQRRRVEEALEAKRQQENFIDMTSHELRNPLSAVVQCAEAAIATLEHLQLPSSPTTSASISSNSYREDIDSTIDSISTILTCSAHQKRVIDDVLTLSKLDSELILITPVKVQICVVILEAMKMFDVECRQLDIHLEFKEDSTAKDFDWVMLDPSRMLQVLINLLTNAIKFTKGSAKRKVTVTLGGSYMRPPEVWESISLRTDEQLRTTILDEAGWGNGTKAYLWIKVSDTGCGMTEDEQNKLFSRFSQATPRTHVKYGGSGLGLFISKTLATLQGGAIGVTSKKDVGSTFAFFVSTRVSDPPVNQPAGQASRVRPVLNKRTISSENAMKAAKLNVLIVEDNLVNQKVLKKQLEKCGWTISVAGDGLEALKWLQGSVHWRGDGSVDQEQDPNMAAVTQHGAEVDIILLDVEMPVMDGLACVRRIREWEEEGFLAAPNTRYKTRRSQSTTSLTPITSAHASNDAGDFRIPVLGVSANARMEQIQEALRAGMDDAITKPFRIPELWPKIQSLVPRLSGAAEQDDGGEDGGSQ